MDYFALERKWGYFHIRIESISLSLITYLFTLYSLLPLLAPFSCHNVFEVSSASRHWCLTTLYPHCKFLLYVGEIQPDKVQLYPVDKEFLRLQDTSLWGNGKFSVFLKLYLLQSIIKVILLVLLIVLIKIKKITF